MYSFGHKIEAGRGVKRPLALLAAAGLLSACLAPTPPARTVEPLPAPVSASAVAVSPDGARLAAVNPDSDSITLVALPDLTLLAEVPVGDDPRTLAFTPDGARVLVANHGAHSLSVVDTAAATSQPALDLGGRPYGIVAGRAYAYVSVEAPPQVVVVDLATLAVTARLDTEPFPTGLALTADQSRLLVTHLYSGRVSVIDPRAPAVLTVIGGDARANLSQFAALSPDGARAYLPQTFSLTDNPDLDYNTTVQPMVSVLSLAAGAFDDDARLRLAELDRPVSVPFAAAVSPDGARLYVAHAGSDDVSVLDLATREVVAHWPVGHNPRGLALSPDGARLYVLNALDGTLDVFDTGLLKHIHTVTLTTLPLDETVLAGKRLFNSALGPMSREHWMACSACHLDGGADARTWLGFPDGPRATPALFDAASTLPLHWNGDLDELQDVEQTIRGIQFGAGLAPGAAHPSLGDPNAGRSPELDALAAYLSTLAAPASPYAPSTETLARGERAFRRWGCAACHTGELFTDQKPHPAEQGDAANGPAGARFDTPSLRGVWATAPFFHDGSAATLRDTLFGRGFHSMGFAMDAPEIEDLLAFMRALPYTATD